MFYFRVHPCLERSFLGTRAVSVPRPSDIPVGGNTVKCHYEGPFSVAFCCYSMRSNLLIPGCFTNVKSFSNISRFFELILDNCSCSFFPFDIIWWLCSPWLLCSLWPFVMWPYPLSFEWSILIGWWSLSVGESSLNTESSISESVSDWPWLSRLSLSLLLSDRDLKTEIIILASGHSARQVPLINILGHCWPEKVWDVSEWHLAVGRVRPLTWVIKLKVFEFFSLVFRFLYFVYFDFVVRDRPQVDHSVRRDRPYHRHPRYLSLAKKTFFRILIKKCNFRSKTDYFSWKWPGILGLGRPFTLYGLPKVGLAVGLASGSGSLNGTILFFIYCSYFPICEIDCSWRMSSLWIGIPHFKLWRNEIRIRFNCDKIESRATSNAS